MTVDERRQRERFALETKALVTYRHCEESPVIESVSANISDSGAFIKTDHSFPMAAKLQVEFKLSLEALKMLKFILSVDSLRQLNQDTALWVKTTGVVIRQEESGVAIIFDKDYTITPMQPSSLEI